MFVVVVCLLGVFVCYVLGYLLIEYDGEYCLILYGWVEVFVEGFGWIGFDLCLGLCL